MEYHKIETSFERDDENKRGEMGQEIVPEYITPCAPETVLENIEMRQLKSRLTEARELLIMIDDNYLTSYKLVHERIAKWLKEAR